MKKRNKKHNHAVSNLPKTVMAVKSFSPMYQFLKDVLAGEVDELDGTVVIKIDLNDGNPYTPVVELFHTWFGLFDELCDTLKIERKDVTYLKLLTDAVDFGHIDVKESEVLNAKKELDALYSLWMKTPLVTLRSIFLKYTLEDTAVPKDYFSYQSGNPANTISSHLSVQ